MPIHTPPRLSIVLPLVKVHIPYLTTLSLVGDRGFLFFSTPLFPLYHPLFTRSGPLRASQGLSGPFGVGCGLRVSTRRYHDRKTAPTRFESRRSGLVSIIEVR